MYIIDSLFIIDVVLNFFFSFRNEYDYEVRATCRNSERPLDKTFDPLALARVPSINYHCVRGQYG